MGFVNRALALAAVVGAPIVTNAQTILYDAPVNLWVQTFLPMGDNNGLVWAPDDLLLYATSLDGVIGAFNPDDGSLAWSFQPTGDGTVPFTCNGEVSFSVDETSVIYAVTEGDNCKVYALSHPYGEELWSSPPLEGTCEGTPYFTSDGMNVFVTHNSDGMTVGRFTVLDTSTATPTVLFQFTQPNPFAPFALNRDNFPGGNYGAGAGNMNDLAIWGLKPTQSATSGEQGSAFAFQMPPSTAIAGPSVTTILNVTSWRHTAPPLISARGQELYWFISRSKVRAWINVRFSAGADAEADFGRGTPPFKAAPYTPVVDDDLNPTIMCGGPADENFACLSTTNIDPVTNAMQLLWSIPLGTGLVYGDPLMSTGGDRVYWVDTSGFVSAADPATGTLAWSAATQTVIQANPELSSDGARFFFADVGGTIVAWGVGENTLPPVSIPPRDPTPSPAPVGVPTLSPAPVAEGGDTPAPVAEGGSTMPSVDVDTAMPSSRMPILTASPVSRPDTSGALSSSMIKLLVVLSACGVVAGVAL